MKTVAALLLVLVLCAVPSRADDALGEDFLRQGRTAETVEHDLDKATILYTKAVTVAGDSKIGLDATLALARLYEERGMRDQALDHLLRVGRFYASMLDDATRRRVQEATLRLLPLGAPPAAGAPAEASPLERKIDDLLSRVDQAPPNEQAQARQQVQQALAPLGKEVLPVLERILFSARPERAQIAAANLIRIGGAEAITVLVRAIREGDAFTREAATNALGSWRFEDADTKARLAALVEPLLDDDRASPVRDRLFATVARSLTGDALLERHRAGGPLADRWLFAALERGVPGAEEHALELARRPGPEGRTWLETLLKRGVLGAVPLALERVRAGGDDAWLVPALVQSPLLSGASGADAVLAGSLDAKTRLGLLDLLLAQPNPWDYTDALKGLLVAVRDDDAATAHERALTAWKRLPEAQDLQDRRDLISTLRNNGFLPTATLLSDVTWSRAYFSTLSNSWSFTLDEVKLKEFWNALLGVLRSLKPVERYNLIAYLQQVVHGPPDATIPPDARWVDVLGLEPFDSSPLAPMLYPAAASGDPRYLEYVRRAGLKTLNRPNDNQVGSMIVRSLRDYRGPGLLAFLREALAASANLDESRQGALFDVLAQSAGDEGEKEVVRIARDPNHPQAARALYAANSGAPMEGLAEVYASAEGALPPLSYRQALITLAQNKHYRPAVPYLIREYRGGPLSQQAEKALDAVRTYHDKIADFERWAKGG